ncbi:hypothetical protein GCM10023336_24440 [Streptomyces similanensis]|uniref:Uncharacterized protein n=1 Tax=Streptomyces similanensis TaxID=1274988 RepID=A0ABP9KC66_9ACTN
MVPMVTAPTLPTLAGLPLPPVRVPDALDAVQVTGMLKVIVMFPLLTAVKPAAEGLTVQTVDGFAEAGTTAMPNAAVPAPTATATLPRGLFMTG